MTVVRCGDKKLVGGERTFLMGIVNVTPDSFSDGGQYFTTQNAEDHALRMLDEGADILDIGGVSTAPHITKHVSEEEELERVLPVIKGLVKRGIKAISVDTSRAIVAERALDAGASWINDQNAALKDLRMAEVMKKADAVVIMHNVGISGVEAGEHVMYDNIINDIASFFKERISELLKKGVLKNNIIVDPGIGFGKGLKDSLSLINGLEAFKDLGAMTLIGVSRKSFLGKIIGKSLPQEREQASLGAAAVAISSGANIIRTHTIKGTLDMVRVLDACKKVKEGSPYENLH